MLQLPHVSMKTTSKFGSNSNIEKLLHAPHGARAGAGHVRCACAGAGVHILCTSAVVRGAAAAAVGVHSDHGVSAHLRSAMPSLVTRELWFGVRGHRHASVRVTHVTAMWAKVWCAAFVEQMCSTSWM